MTNTNPKTIKSLKQVANKNKMTLILTNSMIL